MNNDVAALAPEAALVAAAVVGLLAGSWLPRRRQWLVRLLAAAACLVGLAVTGYVLAAEPARSQVFSSSFSIDAATNAGRIIALAALLLVLCLSVDTVAGHARESEFYVLLLLATAGTLAMVGASDLLLLFAGYLLASVPTYALVGFAKDSRSTEASLKYYLIGALLGVVMLTGIALLYGAGHATSYSELARALPAGPRAVTALGVVAVLAGLAFKLGAVPGHFWVPDVTDGTPAPVAAYVTTVPKIGGLIALYRLASGVLPASQVDWRLLVAVLAAASMTLGNLGALFQTSVKRLLAYSTISQVGYLLLAVTVTGHTPLAQQALLFYLAGYAVTNLAVFAVVAELPRASALVDYRGLGRRHPGLAAALLIGLLGLVGTPPAAVFVGKLEVFTAAVGGGYGWLAGLAVANTVVSLFYYLRWLAPMFAAAPDGSAEAVQSRAGSWSAVGAYSAATASVVLGLISGLALPLGAGTLPH